ncbi:MAG: diaminopimelate epimerase [Myxococcales bacterium]|nr:MAG: diaminopimelate epimerase [Myxococcales bacterium]
MTRHRFLKVQGTGNDFVLFPPEVQPEALSVEQIRRLCDRHFGVGSDGVLFVAPSARGDFMMRMFNPDGTEAEMCGNGIRCFAKYLRDSGLSTKDVVPIESRVGLHACRVFPGPDGAVAEVEVGMGKADYDRSAVGMKGSGTFVRRPIERSGRRFLATTVSMGNPHLVIFEPLTIPKAERTGPLFESHPAFARRTNVEFVEQAGEQHLKVVVYERGAGITLACGTGACAAFAAAAIENRIDPARPVRVDLAGGTLTIRRDEQGEIWMRGPAVVVYEGTIDLEFAPASAASAAG